MSFFIVNKWIFYKIQLYSYFVFNLLTFLAYKYNILMVYSILQMDYLLNTHKKGGYQNGRYFSTPQQVCSTCKEDFRHVRHGRHLWWTYTPYQFLIKLKQKNSLFSEREFFCLIQRKLNVFITFNILYFTVPEFRTKPWVQRLYMRKSAQML